MKLTFWRMSPWADLSGRGGVLADGRWHHAGKPIVYLSENPASCMLETLVHLEVDPEDLPEDFQLLKIELPASSSMQTLQLSDLDDDWVTNTQHTRKIGDEWLAGGQTLLLGVPSAIMPHTQNMLFNPEHPEAGTAKLTGERHGFDPRLLKKLGR